MLRASCFLFTPVGVLYCGLDASAGSAGEVVQDMFCRGIPASLSVARFVLVHWERYGDPIAQQLAVLLDQMAWQGPACLRI